MLSSRIAIVALNIMARDIPVVNLKDNYLTLSAVDQIKQIEERVRDICHNELKIKEPDAMWIIVWREYGVNERKNNKALLSEEKQILKQTMQKLAQEFSPNLTIIAGSILTKKHFNDLSKLEDIKKYYDEKNWIKESEKPGNLEINSIDKELKIINALLENKTNSEIDIIRNTCYIFYNQFIWRHDKIIPFTNERGLLGERSIFQPGNKKNNPSCFKLYHPFSKSLITIGIEICLEHGYATLKHMNEKNPMFHFVLSSSVKLDLNNIYGEYILQLDSIYRPSLIINQLESCQSTSIHFYQSNLLEKQHHLSGPLQLLHPFAKQILDKLNELIVELPINERKLVEDFKTLFSNKESNKEMHEALNEWLKNNELFLLNNHDSTQFTFFESSFSMKKWFQEINKIMINDTNKDISYLDYHSRTNALPLY